MFHSMKISDNGQKRKFYTPIPDLRGENRVNSGKSANAKSRNGNLYDRKHRCRSIGSNGYCWRIHATRGLRLFVTSVFEPWQDGVIADCITFYVLKRSLRKVRKCESANSIFDCIVPFDCIESFACPEPCDRLITVTEEEHWYICGLLQPTVNDLTRAS